MCSSKYFSLNSLLARFHKVRALTTSYSKPFVEVDEEPEMWVKDTFTKCAAIASAGGCIIQRSPQAGSLTQSTLVFVYLPLSL